MSCGLTWRMTRRCPGSQCTLLRVASLAELRRTKEQRDVLHTLGSSSSNRRKHPTSALLRRYCCPARGARPRDRDILVAVTMWLSGKPCRAAWPPSPAISAFAGQTRGPRKGESRVTSSVVGPQNPGRRFCRCKSRTERRRLRVIGATETLEPSRVTLRDARSQGVLLDVALETDFARPDCLLELRRPREGGSTTPPSHAASSWTLPPRRGSRT